jgi:hypothetical protein
LNDEQTIALDDLRKVLYECPQKAMHYNHALIKGSNSVQHKIQGFVTDVKREIEM